jgi:hypothetical protein
VLRDESRGVYGGNGSVEQAEEATEKASEPAVTDDGGTTNPASADTVLDDGAEEPSAAEELESAAEREDA